MKQYTDKQLLQMTKTELVKLYRELEAKQSTTNVEPQDMVQRLREQGYIVKECVSYDIR
jgi:hypothetical protein